VLFVATFDLKTYQENALLPNHLVILRPPYDNIETSAQGVASRSYE
jgi:hypothetical protein